MLGTQATTNDVPAAGSAASDIAARALQSDALERTHATRAATIRPRSRAISNALKGFKLTLWVSEVTEQGLADVHGLLQLEGADPVPFCRIEGVPNPLARALQEAYAAVERVRAKPRG